MAKIIPMPAPTYDATLFEAPWETVTFQVAGTLDGFIDFAVPQGGTYPLSVEEAQDLIAALKGAVNDVQAYCLHDRDALLEKE